MLSVTLLCVLIGLLWYFFNRRFSYWRRHGVEEWKASSPAGNFTRIFTSEGNEVDIADDFYNRLKGKFGGYYFFWKPLILIKDPELMKNVLIKDFDYFADRPRFMNFYSTDIVLRSLFFMDVDEWRPSRASLTKLFTPKRLKAVAVQSVQITRQHVFGSEIELVKDLTKITIDIFSKSFLGIEIKDQSLFLDAFNSFNFLSVPDFLKALLYTLHPKIFNILKLHSLNQNVYKLFSEVVEDVIAEREKQKTNSDDFFDFLIQCKNGKVEEFKGMTQDEIVAHFFIFFFGGYDTTSLTSSYLLYELSKNKDVQEKLYKEIEESAKNGLTYEAVMALPFLNCVFQETSRLYPALGVLKRVCTKSYDIEGFQVPVGTEVVIPCRSFHYDPNYFENPTDFNPSRFAEDPSPDVFMPFGKGPRSCIGMRFGEMNTKMIVSTIILDYKIELSEKNQLPRKYLPSTAITNKPKGGIWVKMTPRKTKNF